MSVEMPAKDNKLIIMNVSGLYFMGSTSAVEQVQILQEEYHGPENLLIKKLNHLYHSVLLMAQSGSNCNFTGLVQ